MVLMEEKVQFTQTWHRNRTPLFDRVNIDMEIPARAPPPVNRIPHYMGHICFSFFFLSLSFFPFFCPCRNSLCRMAGFVKLLPSKFL